MRVAVLLSDPECPAAARTAHALCSHAHAAWRWRCTVVALHARPPGRTDVRSFDSALDLDAWLRDHVDACVVETLGLPVDYVPRCVPTIAHCQVVAHLDVGATLTAAWSRTAAGASGAPVLPPIVDAVPRREAGRGAAVIGCCGDAFDIPWVADVVRACTDRAFVFAGACADELRSQPHVVVAEPDAPLADVCDALLHARAEGETFGHAVADFAARGKPVFCWTGCRDREHERVAGAGAVPYRDAGDLLRALQQFEVAPVTPATAAYAPAAVLPVFRALVRRAVVKFKRMQAACARQDS